MENYRYIIRYYPRISLEEERHSIQKAQNGSKKSKEDLLEEAILIVYNKVESYDINHCNKQGNPHPVKEENLEFYV